MRTITCLILTILFVAPVHATSRLEIEIYEPLGIEELRSRYAEPIARKLGLKAKHAAFILGQSSIQPEDRFDRQIVSVRLEKYAEFSVESLEIIKKSLAELGASEGTKITYSSSGQHDEYHYVLGEWISLQPDDFEFETTFRIALSDLNSVLPTLKSAQLDFITESELIERVASVPRGATVVSTARIEKPGLRGPVRLLVTKEDDQTAIFAVHSSDMELITRVSLAVKNYDNLLTLSD